MCGIVGTASLGGAPVNPAILRRMCDAIVHRGPDDEGYYTTNNRVAPVGSRARHGSG